MERGRDSDRDDAKRGGAESRREEPSPEAHRIDTRATLPPSGIEGAIIVAAEDAAPERVDRATFMTQLREMSSSTALEMLGDRAHGCSYLEAWFARHDATDAETLERMARRYGGVRGATTADALMESLRARLRMGIAYWQSGEDVSGELALAGLPESARAVEAYDGIPGAIAGDPDSAQRVAAELGEGAPLASMGGSLAAIGGGVPDARVHTGAAAQRLADRADAHAFTVGNDVVLGADAPRPGTLAGDVLLAHEVAHVQQQAAGAGSAAATADTEHDADLAGLSLLAAKLGASASFGRSVLATRLSLQRCKKWFGGGDEDTAEKGKDAGPGPVATKDAGAIDAGAAPPPGPTGWVTTALKAATTSGEVKGKDVPTVEAAAEQFGGNKTNVAALITAYSTKINSAFNPNKIGPNTKFNVPSAIQLPDKAALLGDDVDTASSPVYWTWEVEESAAGAAAGRKPYVPKNSARKPDANSGVTIGHGYDMKVRKEGEITADLIAAGMSKTDAAKYEPARTLQGEVAQAWIDKSDLPALNADQDKRLFRNEYRKKTDLVVSFVASATLDGEDDRGYEQVGDELRLKIDFDHMNPTILAFLVDLRFLGNLDPTSWKYIHDTVRTNNLEDLRTLIKDYKEYKVKIHNNYNRYEARCRLLGFEPPVDKATFDAA